VIDTSRVRALARKELRQLLRDPRTKRFVFGAPVIQLLMFGYAVTTDVRNVPTFVVDHDRSVDSRALVQAFATGGYFRIVGRSDAARDAGRALDTDAAEVALEIPAGFARDLAAGNEPSVQVLLDGTNSNSATVAQGYAVRIVQQFGANYARRAGADHGGGVDLRARAWFNPGLESRVYNVPAVVGMLLLMMSLLLTALAVVRERELGTLEQLMVSPITPAELILGKTLPVAAISLVDLVLITGIAVLWFDIPLRGSGAALLLASTIYILASLGLGLLISTVSRTQQEAFMTMFLILLPFLILSGFMYPIETMPTVFQWFTMVNPVRHYLEIVRAVFLKSAGVADITRQLVILSIMAATLFTTATWRFRRTIR
jgi:ABC-2 type transport system permease protein